MRGVRHCRKERTRFLRIYRKISRFQQRFQISADSAKDFKISAKISDFIEDFKISAKISDFARISAEISRFHVISGEISRFQQRFHGSQRPAYSHAGHAPWYRPSATQRVPECVCVKLNASLTLARVMFHRYEVQYIRTCIVGPGIGLLGLFEGLLLL